jgi:sulfate/thiosulfate transport system substrate-binding protein
MHDRARFRSAVLPATLAVAVIVGAAACTSSGAATRGAADVTLNLVAYSTPQPAYEQLIAAFQKTPAGAHVKFQQSYGASGTQANAVVAGQRADVVEFSLQTDMDKLVKKGLVTADWNAGGYHGMVTDSVVVFVVRKGNPKHITDWPDLVRPGISVLTPNPFSSGSARWNILAAYGAQTKGGKSSAQADDYLRALFANVPVQDTSGAKALQDFTSGEGDVLISYENEAIYAQAKGQPVDYVVPNDTILIENPIAVTTNTAHPEQARAFVDFLYSEPGQRIFADVGYRPVVSGVRSTKNNFPVPAGLFTITDLGGWSAVTTRFFDPTDGVITRIEKAHGVSTTR